MKYKISNEEIAELNAINQTIFPKYTSQTMNLANQNAQGTRPKVVGNLSELFPKFKSEANSRSIEEWKDWYEERYPEALDIATDKIYAQVLKLKKSYRINR